MIIRTDGSEYSELESLSFGNEAELELIVALHPNLLALPQEPKVALVKRQVTLPRAGYLDILLVNADGLPIAVEVKLARNTQSRREVVGQLIDYVSVLTSYTVDELDQSVNGALDTALRSFNNEADEAGELDRRWLEVGANLRAGLARYVIVVDEAPDELERIVRFLVERSNLDIRLVKIEKYPDQTGHTIYVPINVVDIALSDRSGLPGAHTETAADLQQVIDVYETEAEPEFPLIGQARNYRFVRPSAWPPSLGLHYEFYRTSSGVAPELHLESESVRFLAPVLKQFAEQENPGFAYPLRWDSNWSHGKGKIAVKLPSNARPEEISRAMRALIGLTFERVNSMLPGGIHAAQNAPEQLV